VPRAQFPEGLEFLFRPSRFKVAHGGRGSAKSWGFSRALLIQAAQRPLRVLCTREVQRSIKDSVHKLLGDQIEALGLGSLYDVLATEIRGKNGSEFIFAGLSTQTIESIKSFEGIDVVWVEEAQAVSKRSWDVLTPTIRKPGSEIWISFNPELESDETYQRFVAKPPTGAVVVQMNWRDNPWFPPELEAERQDTLKRDPESYENIWEGVPRRSVEGAIYAKEIDRAYADGRVRPVPYDPKLKVHTVWDLGWNDSMSILLVQKGTSEIRVIDFIEDSHRTLDEYAALIKQRLLNYGTHYLPHDGDAKDFKTGKTAREILTTQLGSVQIVPNIGVEQGIRAARMLFGQVYFDEVKAKPLLEHLKRYCRKIPTTTDEPTAPVHDEHSHSADAFRYLAVIADQLRNETWGEIKYDNRGII
jgi:phage terminase large subunit